MEIKLLETILFYELQV